MAKIFGLFTFINFFIVGLYLGRSNRRFTIDLAFRVLSLFLVVYLVMGFILVAEISFLLPQQ